MVGNPSAEVLLAFNPILGLARVSRVLHGQSAQFFHQMWLMIGPFISNTKISGVAMTSRIINDDVIKMDNFPVNRE